MDRNSESKNRITAAETPADIDLAKEEVKDLAEESRKKASGVLDMDSFERFIREQTEAINERRREHYRRKQEKQGGSLPAGAAEAVIPQETSDEVKVYKALAASRKSREVRKRSESFLHRIYRFVKGLPAVREKMRGDAWMTSERRRAVLHEHFNDCFEPAEKAVLRFEDRLWRFFSRLGGDMVETMLVLGDMFITIGYYIKSVAYYLWDVLWDIRFLFEEKKNAIFQWFAAVTTVAVLMLLAVSALTAYEYSYYGKTLGVVRSKADIYNTIEALGDKLAEATGANVNIDVGRDIQFRKVFGTGFDIADTDEVLNTLTYMKDLQVEAYAVRMSGEDLVVVENEATAQTIIRNVQNFFIAPKSGVEYTQVVYENPLTVEKVNVLLGELWSPEDAEHYIEAGTTRTVEREEYQPLVTIYSTETATYTENVAYGTKYIDNPSLYADETEVVTPGIYGQDKIIATVTRINGEETGRTIVSTERISNPVDEVQYKGTKPIPIREGTGTFAWPLRTYTISSRFGMRWGSMHQGVDLAAATGTKIYASDGGTVTYAGWQTGYGYVIIINHGGLFETRYAHCSKLLVETGDEVYQGENIGLVGSTGKSTGPHLHFEIRYKGEPHDPLTYL